MSRQMRVYEHTLKFHPGQDVYIGTIRRELALRNNQQAASAFGAMLKDPVRYPGVKRVRNGVYRVELQAKAAPSEPVTVIRPPRNAVEDVVAITADAVMQRRALWRIETITQEQSADPCECCGTKFKNGDKALVLSFQGKHGYLYARVHLEREGCTSAKLIQDKGWMAKA
jgi:hypothetical protein